MTTAFSARAALFHQQHANPGLLCLANAWDVGSARLIESVGAPAIATTSAGVAWSLGYPDGDALPLYLYLNVVKAVAAAVTVPVTADIEGGYSDDPKAVGAAVGRFVAAGAVGINIEDGSASPELLAAKIAAAKRPGCSSMPGPTSGCETRHRAMNMPRSCAAPRSTPPRVLTAYLFPASPIARSSPGWRPTSASSSACR